ncbi:2',3'-cyclic-nucleotide 2'-phosphodiesterase [Siminovitchia terrae]|uniref:2',3'-cyclic-nucleotide 2'-phosphodiesterase n=1 Tax=Siminovitchia terrae TaxID=1914933 RepID=A0A429X2P9_SIMTE|nr:bifunctional UDP-sugar hydrolase/5'-nucleotidase [Siminovitchia terrae]RST57588.1 bifunctional metallophosphatase/5'-nucleotidase [Siminovitchia terrae]GIN90765.1 2',3'-cyclic-nucleotide 2'-phosphodiesterase [Siminovitchia terrae]GIN95502.1 2',3'-cyclic-nucleotide 2'-phosphodiesterase [Siminovitchia terrae]
MTTTNLVILQTSDVHGNIFPIHYGTNAYADIGLGKISTLVKKERSQNNNVLLIDNGDLIQGTPMTYHYVRSDEHSHLPNPMVAVLNEMKYDAGVFGNHEFNYGLENLEAAVKQAKYPWLSANILNEADQTPYFGKPYMIKKFDDDLKVAVLGLTTPYIPYWEKPENIVGLQFADPVKTAKKWVPFLKEEEQADIVVVSYHGGFERDLDTGEPIEKITRENQGYRLCIEVPGIDVLLTGHQHRKIYGKELNEVIVLQSGSSGSFLGKAVLKLEKVGGKWKTVSKDSELLSVKDVPEDQSLLDKVEIYERHTQAWLDQPIGKIEGNMLVEDAMQIRLKDNALIEFINKVQMDAAGVDISTTALFDNESPGFPTNVTMRDVVSNYIYPNTLKVVRISGKDMRDALERSASYFMPYNGKEIEVNPAFTTPKPQHYNYDMWEGIEYIIDISKPEGERVVRLECQAVPVLPDRSYDVVMSNYRAGGGGQYFMYQGKPVIKEIQIDMSELIANYFLREKTVKATVNGNWKVIHGSN